MWGVFSCQHSAFNGVLLLLELGVLDDRKSDSDILIVVSELFGYIVGIEKFNLITSWVKDRNLTVNSSQVKLAEA